MKKKLLFILLAGFILTGCGETEKASNTDTKPIITQLEKDEESIKDFFSIYIDCDEIDITLLEEEGKYNVDIIVNREYKDWYECGKAIKDTNLIESLANADYATVDLEKVTLSCYYDGLKVGGMITEDFENIKDNHYYVDGEGNKKTDTNFKNYVSDYKKSCEKYNYKTIYRNPEKYIGKRAYFKGEIVQVLEDNNGNYQLRVNVTKEGEYYTYYTDTVYAYMPKEAFTSGRPLEEDIIVMYGELGDLTSYESVMGATVTIPTIYVKYANLSK